MPAGMSGPLWSKPLRANSDIRIAVVGMNNHGTRDHLNEYFKMSGVRVAAHHPTSNLPRKGA